MKNILCTLILSICILALGCKEAGQQEKIKEEPMTKVEPELTEGVVEEMVNDIYAAMMNKNGEVLDILCSEHLSYGHSSGLEQNKAEFVDDVVNGPFEFLSITPEEQTIKIVGQTALVRHIFASKAKNAGEDVDIRIGCVQVYQYSKEGDLQLLLRQAYKL